MLRNPFRTGSDEHVSLQLSRARLPAICLCAGMMISALLPLASNERAATAATVNEDAADQPVLEPANDETTLVK